MTETEFRAVAYWCARMGTWFAMMAVLGFLVGLLTGCNADCASPFEKPDTTTQPVECQQSGCAS